MDRAVRELRKIPLDDEASTIAPDIDRITDTSIAWNGDCDLAFSGGTLWLTIDGGEPAVLLADVDAFSVQACDESNLALAGPLVGATCNDVRRVALAVTLQRSGVSESLRAKVFIRSTMRGAEAGG
jgi:hypothetical protein